MDTTILVSDFLNDGQRIVDALRTAKFDVTAAFWLKRSDDGIWRFYVVSPIAETRRHSEGYSQLFTIIRNLKNPRWIDPMEVKLIGPSHRIAKEILAIHQQSAVQTGGKTVPWFDQSLAGPAYESAYLYPLPS